MKAVYFPFTYISQSAADLMNCCFHEWILYQPVSMQLPSFLKDKALEKRVEIRLPEGGDETQLKMLLKDYRNWVDLNQGQDITSLRFHGDGIPFYSESSISRIRQDIRGGHSEMENQQAVDPLFNARLFLLIAHERDKQDDELSRDLSRLDEMEAALFEAIKGDIDSTETLESAFTVRESPDSGGVLTRKRVEAWATLVLQGCCLLSQAMPGIYLTDSRSVFDYVLDDAPDAVFLDCLNIPKAGPQNVDVLPSWQDGVNAHFRELASGRPGEWEKTRGDRCGFDLDDTHHRLRLVVIPGLAPFEFWARFVPRSNDFKEPPVTDSEIINTVIGLLE